MTNAAKSVAHLLLGADLAISFAADSGAVTEEEASELTERATTSLIEIGRKMTGDLVEERPSTRFLRLLAALVLQGQVLIKPIKTTPSVNDPNDPNDRLVGWHDGDWIYLDPEASFQAVARYAQSSGEPFPVSLASLKDALVKDRVATPQPTRGGDASEAGRLTVRERIDGVRRRVMKLEGVTVAGILGQDILGFQCPDEPVPVVPAVPAIKEMTSHV